jgi:pyruvate/2-oxoglutarate/acetoin dehydrogenase E1 component
MHAPVDTTYHDQLCAAMQWLARQRGVLFLGQGVGNAGTGLSQSLESIDPAKRIELPVAEEMQVGMCIGLSLQGYVPVCILPRWNFALRAADQIVNHLDRLPLFSGYRPKVIIRIASPSTTPFNPGPQHDADFTEAFRLMLRTVRLESLESANQVVPAYHRAFESPVSSIVVEFTERYKNVRATTWPKKASS